MVQSPCALSAAQIGRAITKQRQKVMDLAATKTEAQCNRLKLAYEFETSWYPAAELFAREA